MVAVVAGLVLGGIGIGGSISEGSDRSATISAAAAAPVDGPAGNPSASTASGSPGVPRTGSPAQDASGAQTDASAGASPRITVPRRGPGTYRRAKLDLAAPKGSGRVIRFDVRVERGLALDPEAVGREIHHMLGDERSWRGTREHARFQLVSEPRRASLHAYVVTPKTTDKLCYPLLTRGAVSCQNGNRVVLNARRWVDGAKAYGSDVASYREYLVNHEFGHALGYNHVGCPGRGRKAPVMMQQTKGLRGCRPNPWPTVAP